jgi:4-diphosphocytidyl-2-C-methyl-D-erythritol kinase
MIRPIRVLARAKINLYLHVTGKRSDGYHLLDSLVAFAGTGDWIEVESAPNGTITLAVDGPTATLLPGGETNIVEKAAHLLAQQAPTPVGAFIHLTKNLPVAAGIGGGSADAAATLVALSRLWGLEHLPKSVMDPLALSLGADVPVCLDGNAVHMGGIGEILTPAPALPDAWVVLVNPMVACPTPAVFKARKGDFTPAAQLSSPIRSVEHLAEELTLRRNDLAEPAIATVPVIAQVLQGLQDQSGCLLARMSGSGATCFGLFADRDLADAAAQSIKKMQTNWWSVSAGLESHSRFAYGPGLHGI